MFSRAGGGREVNLKLVEPDDQANALELERRVLRALCQEPALRARGRTALREYRWRDLAHRVVFEIAISAPAIPAEQLRQALPTRLTNAGFPDFPWEELFRPPSVSRKDAELLILKLRLRTT